MKSVHNEVLPISQNSNAISKHKSMPDISNQSISPLRTPALSPTLFRQHALPDLNSMRVAPLLPSHPDRAQSQGGQHAEVPWWAVCDGPFLGQRGSHGGFIAGKSMCNGVSDVTEDELKVDVEPNFQCNRYNLKDNMGRTSNIGGEIASENSQNSVVQFEALRESMSGWPICRDLYSSY